jgi:hypothetical protein
MDWSSSLATGWTTDGLEFESRQCLEFSLHHIVQSCPGGHPASCPMGTGSSFPGVKRLEREANHSSPTSASAASNGKVNAQTEKDLEAVGCCLNGDAVPACARRY